MSCVIGTAGHIDHGKTALIKALTGVDTDRLKEEKKRGLSIDLGFAYLELPGGGRAPVVDVPGHERFIRNMLAGVTGIDLVLFVVAADDGIMPQTREHLDIVHLLGVQKGIFAITKVDLVDKSRVSQVKSDIEALVSGTVLMGSPILPVSSVSGEGMEGLKTLLIETCLELKRPDDERAFRLPVDRTFPIKGFGTVVTGTVASGSIKKGDEVLCYPVGVKARVRGLQSLFRAAEKVSAGERAAVNLSGVSHNEIERGNVVVSPKLYPFLKDADKGTDFFLDCVFELLRSMERPLKTGSRLKIHHMTDESLATVIFSGKKQASPGDKVHGRVHLRKPLLMLRGDRFILRDPSINTTIGGGRVLLSYPARKIMLKTDKVAFDVLENGTLEEILDYIIQERAVGMETGLLSFMLNIPEDILLETVRDEVKGFEPQNEFLVSLEKVKKVKENAVEKLESFHRERPGEPGLKEEELIKGLDYGPSMRGLIKDIVDSMVMEGMLNRDGSSIRLPSHRPVLKGEEARIECVLKPLFKNADSGDFRAVNMEDIKKIPFKDSDVLRVLNYLQRQGDVVRLKEGSFISGEAIKLAEKRLVDHLKSKGKIKAAEFRNLLGCGRKLAIEILEYFDKEKVTLRQGDFRTLR